MKPAHNPTLKPITKLVASILAIGGSLSGAYAAIITPENQTLTLANGPLMESSTVIVKPNILFTLDNSGSMAWSFMPDEAYTLRGAVGFRNHMCNSIYYDPSVTYAPPKNANNTEFNAANFTSALYNGFSAGSGNVNLSTSFRAFDDNNSGNSSFPDVTPDTAQPAYYFRFKGTGSPTATQCAESYAAYTAPTANWEKIIVANGTTAQQNNFANWYSFYRTRMLLMKSAAGRAFSGLSDSYRIGFVTINVVSNGAFQTSRYVPLADFTQAQKDTWFSTFYAQSPSGGTPLREALARAGRHFAGKDDGINDGMTGDPIQYSCQQNFSILTTDGYWNGNNGVLLDGIAEPGNQDGSEVRPMYDGAASATSVTTIRRERRYTRTNSGCSGTQRKITYRDWDVTTTVTTKSDGTSTTESSENAVGSTVLFRACQANQIAQPATEILASTTQPPVTVSVDGSSDTLSDVAEYYYKTDLRTPQLGNCSTTATGGSADVCTNNVFASGSTRAEDDNLTTQHMSTYTLGLGINGNLAFDPNYKSQSSGDYVNLKNGTKNWPIPDNGSTQNDPAKSDDLWHTAVNGRGLAFSAKNPNDVALGLTRALANISKSTGTASAAAAASLAPTVGESALYIGKYSSAVWSGDLVAREIDFVNGTVGDTDLWSAQQKLSAMVGANCDNRKIFLFRAGATNNMVKFTWNTKACDANGAPTGNASTDLNSVEQAYFGSTVLPNLSQYNFMTDGSNSTANQRSLAAGANLVNFLRGQSGLEGFVVNDANHLYRDREGPLGDIVGGSPVYVGAPYFLYTDTGYATFKTAQSTRYPMIYAGGNDGMLHAFYAGIRAGDGTFDEKAGKEAWAFIPTAVLPNMHILADDNYGPRHTFFVDGAPIAGDANWDDSWKTILVGGMNKGGKAYYALDITDPENPKALWEFTTGSTCFTDAQSGVATSDCHLGYTFGNPVITKLPDGTWVVLVTSGYNNVNSPTKAGDGQGYLYVIRAKDGKLLYKIGTGVGTPTNESGLSKIAAWVDTSFDNTARRVYGGDLKGNLWRFDINDTIAPAGREAFKLAELRDPNGKPQPVTTEPALSEVGRPAIPIIMVGTGEYLGAADLESTQKQSIYAIKDGFYGTTLTDLRNLLREQTLTNNGTTRSSTCEAADGNCNSSYGWFADFPDSKERVFVSPQIAAGVLAVATGIPESTACTPGGSGWLNLFNYANGEKLRGQDAAGFKNQTSMTVGLSFINTSGVRNSDGQSIAKKLGIVLTTNKGDPQFVPEDDNTNSTGRRVSWRELNPE